MTERLHFHFSLSCIGEGNGSPLQCFCLENPRDGGAWWAAVYGVAQSQTRLKRLSSSSRVLVAAHGIQFPPQGSNPGPLHWEHRVLTTGPPGKSLPSCLLSYMKGFGAVSLQPSYKFTETETRRQQQEEKNRNVFKLFSQIF